ncbi:MAG: CDP-alcohol phosphatidyltransferase family protein [Oscillospiraceae bacterium]|jgi:cardiolipin synthase|nr:CDP-alcohol phosphatidyltransferase family protein [Oscillospiraceae bacterium]
MNIPNILSLFRIALVPVFCAVYFLAPSEVSRFWALGIYLLAQVTDLLDGILARRLNLITRLGRVLDPLGDKLMSFAVIICISVSAVDASGRHFLWWVPVAYFIKDAFMGIGALVLYKKVSDVPPSNMVGKVSTVVFYVVFAVLLLFPDIPDIAKTLMLVPSILLMFVAFALYILNFRKLTKKG